MQFGCFVQLEGLRGRHEGLVHVSQVITCNLDLRLENKVKIAFSDAAVGLNVCVLGRLSFCSIFRTAASRRSSG